MMKFLIFYCCVVTLALFNAHKVMGYPYDLQVNNIGTESAVLQWHTTDNNIEEFELHCTGIQHYITAQGEPHTEMYPLTQFVPGSLTHLLMGELKPNVNYSCTVSEQATIVAQVVGNRISDPCYFKTLYDNPEQPRPPIVHLQDDQNYRVDLFPVSSKNGPLMGYKLQFHVVKEETPIGDPILHKNELTPFGEYAPTDPVHASKASQPVSFQLSFTQTSIPAYVLTDNSALFATALKKDTKYSIVMIAFSKSNEQSSEESIDLYSVSDPSNPFVARRGHSIMYQSAASSAPMGPNHLALSISLGVIIPILVLGWVLLIGIYLLCRAQRKKFKPFSRSDVIEASKLRKAQLEGNVLQEHNQYSIGDVPWLDPEYDSRNTNHAYSTPNFQTDSANHSPSNRSSKGLIQFSPNPKAHNTSEQSKHNGSPPLFNSSPRRSSSGFSPNLVPLPYTTTVDENTNKPVSNGLGVSSPTMYYSANRVSTEDDEPILRQSSSSVFIPRGLSDGPQSLRDRSSSTPLERLFHQLSGGSEESQEEDKAPELEMDMYDIHV